MKENVDYKIIPYGEDSSAVELLCDPFIGVQYIYGFVKLNEDNGMLNLKFDYTVIGDIKIKDSQLKKFEQVAGDIFVDIISNESGVELEEDESKY